MTWSSGSSRPAMDIILYIILYVVLYMQIFGHYYRSPKTSLWQNFAEIEIDNLTSVGMNYDSCLLIELLICYRFDRPQLLQRFVN